MTQKKRIIEGGTGYQSPELMEGCYFVESGFCTSGTGESYSNSGKTYVDWVYESEN